MDNNNKGNINGFDSTEPVVNEAGSVNNENIYASAGDEQGSQTPAYSYTPNTTYNAYNADIGGSQKPPKNDKHNRFGIGTIVLCVVLSVIVSTAASLSIAFGVINNDNKDSVSTQSQVSSESDSSEPSTIIQIEGNVESLVEAVYDKAANSVVGIRTKASVESFFGGQQESTGEGSGVIYTADGYIITNYHVIESVVKYQSAQTAIEVFMMSDPATPIDAKVVGYSVSSDLAVIKIEKTGLTPIEIGDSDAIKVGQYAIAIGSPGGLEFLNAVSYGIISGLNRSITVDSIGTMELIQTDAAINPGNSGGALLNSNGQLIGISSSKLVNESFEGMGFAIPVNTALEVVKGIIDNKDNPSPYIGIEIYTYSSAYLEKYSLPKGAAVKSVVSGAPAAQAGIRAGDIITEFNKISINEYTDFIKVLEECTLGTKVTAKIYRNGRYYSTTVTIGSNNGR